MQIITCHKINFHIPKKVCYTLQELPEGSGAVIATHNGRFHADDVAAVAILLQLKGNENAQILRTRDTALLKDSDFVVDVGLVYDPCTRRFDHHQSSFNESYSEKFRGFTRMSSAGLVFKHYGEEFLRDVFKIPQEDIPTVKEELYNVFFSAIDAIDNGVTIYAKQFVDHSSYSSRIHRLNNIGHMYDDKAMSDKFLQGVKMALLEIEGLVYDINLTVVGSRHAMAKAFADRFTLHESGKIIYLDEFLGLSALYELEKNMKEVPKYSYLPKGVLFIIYRYDDSSYRIRSVSVEEMRFNARLRFPDKFCRGYTNFPGITFLHREGFIGGADTIEHALNLIEATFNYYH